MPHLSRPRSGGRHRRESTPLSRDAATDLARRTAAQLDPGAHRRRAPRAGIFRPAVLTSERSRAVTLTAALGAALAAGIAGGTAAAATTHRTPPPPPTAPPVNATTPAASTDLSGPATPLTHDLATPLTHDAAAALTHDAATPLTQDAAAPLTHDAATPLTHEAAAADAVRHKPRPRPVAVPSVASVASAAWVDPNPNARVTSCFGPRWGRMHEGVDLAAPDGTPIVAAGAGVVVRAGVAEGYGNAVLIDHGDGFLTHYGHLSAIAVTAGQHVAAGQQIGNEGSTGHSTGPHLHFEVHVGHYQNPIEPTAWMRAHGVDIPGCA
ncbi:M23 family metallopeptidase [Actinoplanes sp. NPDC051513]|uniref:M23 family metallopeptidase n=1 Tax=Actinoplanes sp. NPDC051513 TaxID=3363908 RepID=UPI00378B2472